MDSLGCFGQDIVCVCSCVWGLSWEGVMAGSWNHLKAYLVMCLVCELEWLQVYDCRLGGGQRVSTCPLHVAWFLSQHGSLGKSHARLCLQTWMFHQTRQRHVFFFWTSLRKHSHFHHILPVYAILSPFRFKGRRQRAHLYIEKLRKNFGAIFVNKPRLAPKSPYYLAPSCFSHLISRHSSPW